MSTKKVKARKLLLLDRHCHDHHFGSEGRVGRQDDNKFPSHLNLKAPPPPLPPSDIKKPPLVQFYSRRRLKRPRNSFHSQNLNQKSSFFDALLSRFSSISNNSSALAEVKEELEDVERADDGDDDCVERLIQKKKQKQKGKFGNSELLKLGVDSSLLRQLDGPRLRGSRSNSHNLGNNKVNRRRKRDPPANCNPACTHRAISFSFSILHLPVTIEGCDGGIEVSRRSQLSRGVIGGWAGDNRRRGLVIFSQVFQRVPAAFGGDSKLRRGRGSRWWPAVKRRGGRWPGLVVLAADWRCSKRFLAGCTVTKSSEFQPDSAGFGLFSVAFASFFRGDSQWAKHSLPSLL